MRLDVWLAAALGTVGPGFSRSRTQALIREGAVEVEGRQVREARHRLAAAAKVTVALPAPPPQKPLGEDIPLDILFEDDQILVVDKPAGLVVHPGAGNPAGTLVNALIGHCGARLSDIGGADRSGIVHRLDKDTSGVLVAAKTDTAHEALAAAFADHGRTVFLERAYLALVWGVPTRMAGTIEAPLGRARGDRTRRAVVDASQPDARHAVTHYKVAERFSPGGVASALVECRLETGRTHQIRVHLAHAGHPVVGDRDYGGGFRSKVRALPETLRALAAAFPRQALHAHRLAFEHPITHERMCFLSPLPPDMAELVDGFRRLTPETAG